MGHHEHLRSLVSHENKGSGSEARLVAGDAWSGKPNKETDAAIGLSLTGLVGAYKRSRGTPEL